MERARRSHTCADQPAVGYGLGALGLLSRLLRRLALLDLQGDSAYGLGTTRILHSHAPYEDRGSLDLLFLLFDMLHSQPLKLLPQKKIQSQPRCYHQGP